MSPTIIPVKSTVAPQPIFTAVKSIPPQFHNAPPFNAGAKVGGIKPKVFPNVGIAATFTSGNALFTCGTAGTVLVSVSTQLSLVGDKVICPSPLITANGFTFSTPDIILCDIAESSV